MTRAKFKDRMREMRERAERATLIRPVETMPGYYADAFGNIWSTNSRWGGFRELSAFPDNNGYLKLKALRDGKLKRTPVHRMVAIAFHGIPEPDNMQVRHLDGSRTNNRPENLAWETCQENALDRKIHGTERAAENGRISSLKRIGIFKSFCPLGHSRMAANERCKKCNSIHNKKYRLRQKGKK